MTDNQKPRSMPLIQIQTLGKYLQSVKSEDIFNLSMKIYPVISAQQPYASLFSAIKKQVVLGRGKGAMFDEIGSELVAKAYSVSDSMGDQMAIVLEKQPQFLMRFQNSYSSNNNIAISIPQVISSNMNNNNNKINTNNNNIHDSNNQEQKKQPANISNQSSNQNSDNNNNTQNIIKTVNPINTTVNIVQKLLLSNPSKQSLQQKFTPILAPLRDEYIVNSPLLAFGQQQQSGQLNDQKQVYKIGFRDQQQKNKIGIRKDDQHKAINSNKIVSIANSNNDKKNIISTQIDNWTHSFSNFSKKQTHNHNNQHSKPSSLLKESQQLNTNNNSNKNKNQAQRIINTIGDPFSSGRPATVSPTKSWLSPAHLFQNKIKQIEKSSQKTFFSTYQQQKSKNMRVVDKYVTDNNLIRNLTEKQTCLCETSCQNIVLSEDSFLCVHCQNIYHTRCMKKTKDSKNCSICYLRLMIPNKVVCQQLFVGLMKKGKKKHDLCFELSQQIVTFLKSKKDSAHKLQLRCFRLKQQTQNQNLFPDSCVLSINGKQLKQFKPLHKQSSLKYRKDETISIQKNFQVGQNKIVITEFHPSSNAGLQRVQPEDHLIGLYIIQEEQLNATVQRIVGNYMTTLQQSRGILNKSFYINQEQKHDHMSEQSETISCQVLKIPLTCALTTEKLNYPARGIFCQHFQCFDLKNFIMMTSSSSYPRWVCPICKASCYEFKIDCILTEILNQYVGCNKVETLVLYKNGIYEVLDKDQDPIDVKGHKLIQSLQRNISQLKIVDQLKRQRQKQAQRQLLKQQQAEKKKRKIVQLPPEDQIVSLLSDSQS